MKKISTIGKIIRLIKMMWYYRQAERYIDKSNLVLATSRDIMKAEEYAAMSYVYEKLGDNCSWLKSGDE